jgi:short subunit dehydrogenase-like uncharacterized protein
MPDVLVFGATGYTGQLTVRALAARGAEFIVAGRNRTRLEELAAATGAAGVAIAEVGDVDALAEAAGGARVLLSCVGPFSLLGHTAAEAAVRAGVNYLDSTGEGDFIASLVARYDAAARTAGIAMAPALGFDEVPADVAATMATAGLDRPDLVLTYAFSARASAGTQRSAIGIVSSPARWMENGSPRNVRAGQESRWAPMPAPLGPSLGISFPLAEGHLAPLHLNLRSLKLFLVAGLPGRIGLRLLSPALSVANGVPPIRNLVTAAMSRGSGGPDQHRRAGASWTILAEAVAGSHSRNVVMSGRDVYGLTAELLATGALEMARPEYGRTGVLAPVQAIPPERWQQELRDKNVTFAVYES